MKTLTTPESIKSVFFVLSVIVLTVSILVLLLLLKYLKLKREGESRKTGQRVNNFTIGFETQTKYSTIRFDDILLMATNYTRTTVAGIAKSCAYTRRRDKTAGLKVF